MELYEKDKTLLEFTEKIEMKEAEASMLVTCEMLDPVANGVDDDCNC